MNDYGPEVEPAQGHDDTVKVALIAASGRILAAHLLTEENPLCVVAEKFLLAQYSEYGFDREDDEPVDDFEAGAHDDPHGVDDDG